MVWRSYMGLFAARNEWQGVRMDRGGSKERGGAPSSKNSAPPSVPPMKFMTKHNLPLVRGGSLGNRSIGPPSCNYGHPTDPPQCKPQNRHWEWKDSTWGERADHTHTHTHTRTAATVTTITQATPDERTSVLSRVWVVKNELGRTGIGCTFAWVTDLQKTLGSDNQWRI